MFKYKFGFTLSEILITLVIIGVISAVTLPVLFVNYQEKALRTALLKNFSVLKQVLMRYKISNGVPLIPSDVSGRGELYSKIKPYFNFLENTSSGNLIKTKINYKNYNGNKFDINANNGFYWILDDGTIILNDGTIIYLENSGSGGSSSIIISADVNGYKEPNTLGKDLFMFQIMEDGELLPMGAKGTKYTDENTYCSKTSNNDFNGASCTNKVIMKS